MINSNNYYQNDFNYFYNNFFENIVPIVLNCLYLIFDEIYSKKSTGTYTVKSKHTYFEYNLSNIIENISAESYK